MPGGDLERDSDWSQPGRITTARNGRFRFDGVGTGEALKIQIDESSVRSQAIEVPALAPGEIRDDLVLRVRRAGSIEVRVQRAPDRRRERLTKRSVSTKRDLLGRGHVAPGPRPADAGGMEPSHDISVSAGASVDGAFRADAVQEIEVVAGRRARVDLRIE